MSKPVRRKLSIIVPSLPASMEHHNCTSSEFHHNCTSSEYHHGSENHPPEDGVKFRDRHNRKAVDRESHIFAERLNDG